MNTNPRQPSIHITEKNLRALMRGFFDYDDNADDMVEDLLVYIMQEAKKLSLEKRSVNITNQTMAKKVLNKVTNDKSDITLLSQLIFHVRKQLKHKGIKPITVDSAEWTALKKLTPIVNNFCNDFGIEKREGYIAYVKIGLKRISSFRGYINKLYDMSETINSQFEAEQFIAMDENKKLTRDIHDYYVSLIVKNTGFNENYLDKPLKYVKFIEVANLVNELKIDYHLFINAQFDGLAWANSYPEPEQLVSDKYRERLNKYVYSSKGKEEEKQISSKADKTLTNVLNKIKNGKGNN